MLNKLTKLIPIQYTTLDPSIKGRSFVAIAKEIYDEIVYGGFDWKDLLATIIIPLLIYIQNIALENKLFKRLGKSRANLWIVSRAIF